MTIALISTCLAYQTASAEFQSQDPRALGMGGVGTAAANSAQAHFYNPSLLANAKEGEKFNFEIPVTLRIADTDNLIDSIDDFADEDYFFVFSDSLIAINDAIDAFNDPTNPDPPTPDDLIALKDNMLNASINLRTGINSLSDKSLAINGNAGLMTSMPNRKISWTGYVNAWADIGAKLNIDPRDDTAMEEYIDFLNDLTFDNTLPDPVENLYSSVSLEAIQVTEVGVSLAIPYQINNYSFDVGVTPKYMAVKALSFTRSLEESENDSDVIDLNDSKDYNSFNFDIGLSKKLNQSWKSGVVIKNLIPQSFETPTGSEVSIKPAVRIGTSYQNNWVAVAADLDLTKNTSPASNQDSQYLAIGAEVDAWLAKVRLGYRSNLASSNNNTVSAGLGLYLFGLNIDAAVAAGEGETGPNDINAGIQVGLQW